MYPVTPPAYLFHVDFVVHLTVPASVQRRGSIWFSPLLSLFLIEHIQLYELPQELCLKPVAISPSREWF